MPPKTAIVIGCGDRGITYSNYALEHPSELKIIGLADPREDRLSYLSNLHDVPSSLQFEDWKDILTKKIADIAIITTPDHLHHAPVLRAIELKYHILLEKPMATTEEHCREIVQATLASDKILQVCHVLRYTTFFSTIKKFLQDGELGEIVNISLHENVSYYHYAHSFIRGNWHNRATSSPMILAKSCHDLDLLYWLVGELPSKITSYGSQRYFGKNNKPENTPARCTDGCPIADTCLYYAPRLYLDIVPLLHISKKGGPLLDKIVSKIVLSQPWTRKFPPFNLVDKYSGWPINIISVDSSIASRVKALQEGPYGRCVYNVEGHDVVDHQVTAIEFNNEVTAVFTMHGHSSEEGRAIRVDGTKGTLTGYFKTSGTKLSFVNSLTNKKTLLLREDRASGHGGGDTSIMVSLLAGLENKTSNKTPPQIALISHLMAFAADHSRLNNIQIDFDDFLGENEL